MSEGPLNETPCRYCGKPEGDHHILNAMCLNDEGDLLTPRYAPADRALTLEQVMGLMEKNDRDFKGYGSTRYNAFVSDLLAHFKQGET